MTRSLVRRAALTCAALLLPMFALAATVPGSPGAARAEGGDPAWPDTAPGRHARAFFAAYGADEAAMRAFWTAHGSTEALAARPVDARLDVWRQMRATQGALTPLRVLASGDDFVAVRARTGQGEAVDIRFLCADDAAHGLVALRLEDPDEDKGPNAAEPPAPAGPPPSEASIVAALGHEVDSLATAGAFAGTVVLDASGRELYARAVGLASRERDQRMQIDTRMNVGSINKLMTLIAIRQLAEQGKLRLDDTIDRFLPDYPAPAASQITVRMLLEHRAGVPDALHDPALWKDPLRVRSTADWYALVRPRPLEFPPGTKQQYSNGGYVLLGEIISRVSGEDYYDYIAHHVTGPAGMTRTAFDPVDEAPESRATAYPAAGRRQQPGRGSAAGGGYSTVGDLLRLARALREGRLLDAADTRELVGDHPGMAVAGGAPGVNALLELEGPYTLVVLTNLDPPAAEHFSRTVGRLLRRAAGDDLRGARHEVRAGGPASAG